MECTSLDSKGMNITITNLIAFAWLLVSGRICWKSNKSDTCCFCFFAHSQFSSTVLKYYTVPKRATEEVQPPKLWLYHVWNVYRATHIMPISPIMLCSSAPSLSYYSFPVATYYAYNYAHLSGHCQQLHNFIAWKVEVILGRSLWATVIPSLYNKKVCVAAFHSLLWLNYARCFEAPINPKAMLAYCACP